LKAIPIQVMEYRDKLEGKVIFLFATVPFQPNDTVEGQIHRHTVAFLPRECDFRGIYLCSAQPSDALLRNMEEIVSQHPENSRAKHWLERFMCAAGHPDSADIQQGCRFMKHVLELA